MANADLDLSSLSSEPTTVKLPDGNVYRMTNPLDMTAYQFHVFFSRKEQVDKHFDNDDEWTDEAAEDMLRILADLCQAVLPDAPRDVINGLPFTSQLTLIDKFSKELNDETQSEGEGDDAEGKEVEPVSQSA